jgi:hypothetical protein
MGFQKKEDRRISQKISAFFPLRKTYRMALLSAESIYMDSTIKRCALCINPV